MDLQPDQSRLIAEHGLGGRHRLPREPLAQIGDFGVHGFNESKKLATTLTGSARAGAESAANANAVENRDLRDMRMEPPDGFERLRGGTYNIML